MRRFLGPVAMGIVLGAALLVGSGIFDAPGSAASARITAIERDVKCPACVDLSVAQSNAPASIALRQWIVTEVHRGASTNAILDTIVARYGTQALLEPPPGGIDAVLWAVPTTLAVGGAAALALVVVRRRRT
jgi:cytochrome c-type biogenesis protein CcmH